MFPLPVSTLVQIKKITMWMQHFGHPTPKRTALVSNTERLKDFQTGKLTRSAPASLKTTVVYQDKYGKQRFKGGPDLRSTQSPGCRLRVPLHIYTELGSM